jgi:hypothetical protein
MDLATRVVFQLNSVVAFTIKELDSYTVPLLPSILLLEEKRRIEY